MVTEIDSKFTFDKHSDSVFKKDYQHLGLLRKLRGFNIEKDIHIVVYKSLIKSVLTFNIVSWLNTLSVECRHRLLWIINMAGEIISEKQVPLSDLYHVAVQMKASVIVTFFPFFPV